MRMWLAFRVGWRVLRKREFAEKVGQLMAGTGGPAARPEKTQRRARPSPPARPAAPARSDAITLLGALQREARFVDMVKESLDSYSDAQIGAAARDVLRDCGAVLDRMFQLQPVVDQPEGTALDVPAGFDAGCYRLSGQVTGQPPYQGRLVHHGWKAAICELPRWTGKATSRAIIAPVEVEVTAAGAKGGEQ